MLRVTLKDLLARKRRLVTTGIAIILGIGFLAATQILGGVLTESIESTFADVYEGYDAVVRSPDVQETGFGEVRPPIEAAVVDQVRGVDGVRAAYGIVEAPTVQLVGPDGKVISTGFGPPTLVYNWVDDPIRPGVLTEGQGPTAPDEMVMDFKTAGDNGWQVGDEVTVAGQVGQSTFTLVGLVGLGEEGDRFAGAKPLFFLDEVAQELSGQQGQYNYVAAGAADAVSQDELAESLGDALPDLQVITGEAFTDDSADQVAQFVGILTTVVTVFGVISLVVAAFIIYNTFSIIVAQRTRETALLRAIGASRRQVVGATMVEAVLIGLVASAVGLVVGSLLATAAKALAGRTVPVDGGLAPPGAGTVLMAFAVGIVVTVVSAVIPAIRASRIPPMAALSEVSLDKSAVSVARVVWGGLFVIGGVVLVTLGLVGVGDAVLTAGGGLLLILLSLAVVLGPLLARPASRGLAWPVTSRGNVTARIAAENAARNPRRTASTAAALTIGVTLVVVIAVLAASIKDSVNNEVAGALGEVDFIINAGSFSFLGVPPDTTEEARQVDGVAEASPVKFAFLRLLDDAAVAEAEESPPEEDDRGAIFGVGDDAPPGEDVVANGADPGTFFDLVDLGEIEGDPTRGGGNLIYARAEVAEDRGWEVGDTIPAWFAATGEQDLTLAATYTDGLGPGDDFYLSNDTIAANAVPGFDIDFAVYVSTEDGADRARVKADLDAINPDRPDVVVQDREEFVESQTSILDVFVAIVYALLGLAVLIALIGIANTLSLSVLERTREFGLLRAVGMSKRQLRWAVRFESAIVAVFGTLLGMALGIASAWVLSTVLTADDPGLLQLRLPIVQLVVITVFAALAGLLAAVLPARRAARLDVLAAISSE